MDALGSFFSAISDFIRVKSEIEINVYYDGEYEEQSMPKVLLEGSLENSIPALPLNFEYQASAQIVTNGNDDDHGEIVDLIENAILQSDLIEYVNSLGEIHLYEIDINAVSRSTEDTGIQKTIYGLSGAICILQ